jgi:hypothetical protein
MAERGLGTGKINYSIHDTIAVVIQVGQKMSYLHDFHYAMFVVGKSPVRTMGQTAATRLDAFRIPSFRLVDQQLTVIPRIVAIIIFASRAIDQLRA